MGAALATVVRSVAEDFVQGRVRGIFLLMAVVFGAIHAWTGRYAMNADGISYLDIADAYLRGDWGGAVSTVWSPLYSWMLALWLSLLKPTPYWQFPAVQLLNFLVYVGTLTSFGFFMTQLLRYRREYADRTSLDARVRVPDWALLAAGYMLFIWSSLNLITVSLVTPHMTLAALVYLATGLLLRMQFRPAEWQSFVLLGGVLGFAYLARSPMFLLAFVFLGLAMLAGSGTFRVRERIPRVLVALAVFLLVAAVNAVPLFVLKGRLLLGDFTKLNYVFWVNRVPNQHWQGDPPGSGTPKHPTRRLFARPAVYEFGNPIGGTYPVWYDPSYWNEGVTPGFDLTGHAKTFFRSIMVGSAQGLLSHWLPSVITCALVGYYAQRRGWLSWADVAKFGNLFTLSVAAFAMYAPVQLIDRYVGGFLPLIWLGLLSAVALRAGPGAKRTAVGLAVAVLVLHGMLTVPGMLKRASQVAGDLLSRGHLSSSHVQWEVAEGLRQIGVQPGGKVAVIGSGWNAYWARLARVRIVAEIPRGSVRDFWAADEEVRQAIMSSLADVGVEVVVVSPRARPRSVSASTALGAMGWRRIGQTGYYAFDVRK